jgi:signal transduction histidine kinase
MILYHLIENAVKFTIEGGITISVENNHNSFLTISIEDSGVGMSQEYMKNMFKLFSQEDHGYSRQYDGNGLGLALTKRLCEINNIDISVKSEKGKGSTFTLTFPK